MTNTQAIAASSAVCIVCGAPLNGLARVRLADSRLAACAACRSWTYLPRPSSQQQALIHDNGEYFEHPYFALRRALSPATIRRCRDVFARLAEAIHIEDLRGQPMLDIGCDTGTFLEAAAQTFGVVPVGVDVAGAAVAEAGRRGIEAYHCQIEKAPGHLVNLPAITAIDLIEHVAEPRAFLREIRRRLRPGGAVYLETPNIDSIVYRLGRLFCNLARGRPRPIFERLFPAQHIQYFTPESLASSARATGFEVVRIGTRILPWADVGAVLPVRLIMAGLQAMESRTSHRILIYAVLRRPTQGEYEREISTGIGSSQRAR
jgi:2-polyprenyl-3-methyl-5-hydroxy-6-metoxy-1,4-benzoquinol methylase